MVIGFEYPFKTRVYRMWVSHAAHFIVYSCEWFLNYIDGLTREWLPTWRPTTFVRETYTFFMLLGYKLEYHYFRLKKWNKRSP